MTTRTSTCSPDRFGRRHRLGAAIVLTSLTIIGVACSSRGTSAEPTTMAQIDDVVQTRVDVRHLDGAGLLVVVDGTVERNRGYGRYTTDTVIPIASASKWLTAATMLTLVDEGRVSLDDPVSTYLPQFTGTTGSATIRQLLSHTSGIANADCIWDERSTLEACIDSIATTPAVSTPGARFAYGNTSYSVAGRIIEVVTGLTFEKAFEQRIAEPLGMLHTRFDGNYHPTESNPVPAASAESTLADYGRFVAMLSNDGMFEGRRILSTSSARATEADAVKGIDTSRDGAVRTTGIPTYGLGAWRDITSADDSGVVTSGNGAYGFYPWVDRARNAYGIIEVFDQRGSDLAVPESQQLLHRILAVLDREHGTPAGPPTTVHRR